MGQSIESLEFMRKCLDALSDEAAWMAKWLGRWTRDLKIVGSIPDPGSQTVV